VSAPRAEATISGNYTLAHNDPSAPGQSDWRWCKGLAAMGVPPSIPNFDQLCQAGKGYLVQTLADQATQATGFPVPRRRSRRLSIGRTRRRRTTPTDRGQAAGSAPTRTSCIGPAMARINIISQSATELRDLDPSSSSTGSTTASDSRYRQFRPAAS
jgi:hypothetical protein